MSGANEEARLRAVVDASVDGVILIDAQGGILMFNPACEKLFGYQAQEVLGQNVKMLMPSPYGDEHDRFLESFKRTGERKIIGIGREVDGQRKDGSTFPMDLSVGEAKQDNDSVFVGIVHDISERKRTESELAQAQKMDVVGQLSGGIAHDFNNLLTIIVGSAEILSEAVKPQEELHGLANSIVEAGERGAELTQRLLAFGRRQTLRPAELDCNQLVARVHKLLRRTLSEAIEIATTLANDLGKGFADAGQLENALLNLALNARDAMPDGGRLTITTSQEQLDVAYSSSRPEVTPGDYIMIAVTDTGTGMTKEVQQRAFEPFFTTKEVGKGSGLGLSMVYGFVKQSNGHVAIYSEPGLGTTVRIYLPALGATAENRVAEEVSEQLSHHGGEFVLVVEDDPSVRKNALASLESLGYRTVAAKDGREALEKLARAKVDLLFTDVVMPGGMNGFELAELARRMRPELKVLMTSGYALEALTERGILPADVVILNKPYRRAQLAKSLREVLEKQRHE